MLAVYLGVTLLETVPADPGSPAYRLLLGRLVNLRFGVTKLASLFGHDARTLQKWGEAVADGDPAALAAMLAGRGASAKVTQAMERFVKVQYRQLRYQCRDYRRVIMGQVHDVFRERVSRESLRRLFRAADREDALSHSPPAAAECPAGPDGGDETVIQVPAPAGMGCPSPLASVPGPDNQTPVPADIEQALTLPWAGRIAGKTVQAIHHAGLILVAAFMDAVRAACLPAGPLHTQWLSQILQGAVNLEQAGRISVDDMAWFNGPVTATIKAQRDRLEQAAGIGPTMAVYAAGANLIPDGPGRGEVFFYDPHAKECTGALRLLSGWCGRRHATAKVLYLDVIHSVGGFVCFMQHYDAYYDLRERFFMTLNLFDLLFPADRRKGRTFVLDRGIYGRDTFARFIDRGDNVLTWEKDYRRDGWRSDLPAEIFPLFRLRNGPGDVRDYHFEAQCAPWPRDPRLNRIVVRATNPSGRTIEVSILCSNPALSVRRAVKLMFSRWVQENGFKDLDRHFGLMQITSYAHESYSQIENQLRDRPVDCPEYRDLKKQAVAAEKALGHLLVAEDRELRKQAEAQSGLDNILPRMSDLARRLEAAFAHEQGLHGTARLRAMVEVDQLRAQGRDLCGERDRLQSEIRKARTRMEKRAPALLAARAGFDRLQSELDQALRQQSRLQLLIDARYVRLDTRKKAFLDAHRVMAHSLFRLLLGGFRPIYGNHRNDAVLLRELTRADGFMVQDQGVVRIGLWLRGTYQAWQMRAFRTFLQQITRLTNTQFAGRRVPVHIQLIDSPADIHRPTQCPQPTETKAFNLPSP